MGMVLGILQRIEGDPATHQARSCPASWGHLTQRPPKGRSTPTEGGQGLALEAHALREHPTPGLVIMGMARKGHSDPKAQGGGTAGWSAGTPLSWTLP